MEFTKLLFAAILYVALSSAQSLCAQPSEPPASSESEVTTTASALANSIVKARERFIADFGPKAFDRGDFPDGRSLGDIWEEYLDQAGYPHAEKERERLAHLLERAGLDNSAVFVLVTGRANEEAIEYLLAGLNRIVVVDANH